MANLQALNLSSTTLLGTNTTYINPNKSWDFDPTNGISSGKHDLVGIMEHELGHILGFDSGVDFLISGNPLNPDFAYFSTLDLYRYAAGYNLPQLSIGDDPYFSIDGGTTNLGAFANGTVDGFLMGPSHWAEQSTSLGLMDVASSTGERIGYTDRDLVAMDVIGWDLASQQPPPPSVPEPSTFLLMGGGLIGLAAFKKIFKKS